MGFDKDFLWGAASAAYQVEGAYADDGKGLSIWDALCGRPGRIAHGENGNVACDHYHRFREDVALMKEMGVKNYRFSISWPRVMPDGVGAVNEKGIQFYSDLIDALLEAGIQPLVTLYHWDLPYTLYQKGGWRNPEMPDWFAAYATLIGERFGDRVKHFMTINEPQIFIGLGYSIGSHAPFEQTTQDDILLMTRIVLLAHGKAVTALRNSCKQPIKVGLAPTGGCCVPKDDSPEALEIARRRSFELGDEFVMSNAWWGDPIFLGKYPEGAKERFGDKMYTLTEEEWASVSQPLDFYGFNTYEAPGDGEKPVTYTSGPQYTEHGYIGCPLTCVNWHVTPKVLYYSPKFLYERYGLPILITENGMAMYDVVSLDGKVHDPYRIDFVHRYLLELRRAADDGIPVMGYMYWSIMDNFEWALGYDPRFGMIHVDFRDGTRTIKDSGYWYRDVMAQNGENL